MKEIIGDIWDFHKAGNWIVITTNGTVRKDGACVMDRGVALETKIKYPELPYLLGSKIIELGNKAFMFKEYKIFTLPVKHNWWEKADIDLILRGIGDIKVLVGDYNILMMDKIDKVYMVRPGCGNGGLDWKDVKPILWGYLDDRFIVCENDNYSKIVKRVRYGIFETNSSSTHSLVISFDKKYLSLRNKHEGSVLIIDREFGETGFGWENRKYYDIGSKVIYAFLQAKLSKNSKLITMLEDVLREYYQIDDIVWSVSLDDSCYIDHQSVCVENLAMFKDKETLKQFLFNPFSYIQTGNDND